MIGIGSLMQQPGEHDASFRHRLFFAGIVRALIILAGAILIGIIDSLTNLPETVLWIVLVLYVLVACAAILPIGMQYDTVVNRMRQHQQ